jgi:tRNA-splicing ligase RtcB
MGRDTFPKIARYAAKLKKSSPHITEEALITAVSQKFGLPERKLEMNREPAAFKMIGVPGVDFDQLVDGRPPRMSSQEQMKTAMRLPVAVGGAMLPDAHPSRASLPVGGVALLDNAISPKMVGPDISCSMRFTPLQGITPEDARRHQKTLLVAIVKATHFGPGVALFGDGRRREHPVMNDPAWADLPSHLRQLKHVAQDQLGSSGSGNHFVDLVVLTSQHGRSPDWPFDEGQELVALISHSGSRGAGFKLAQYYGRLSEKETKITAVNVPRGYEWLSMNGEGGREYLHFMQLLGRYAEANHELIHTHFMLNSGLQPFLNQDGSVYHVYNQHNFAWQTEGDYSPH